MSYQIQYVAAWVVAAIGVVAGIMATSIAAPNHPSWLTTDFAATAALVSLICVSLGALLPQVHRTPGTREANYLSASMGVLPPDLAAKHPEVLVPQPPTG